MGSYFKISVILATVASFAIVSYIFLSGNVAQDKTTEVILEITYSGDWNATMTENGYSESWSGWGRMEKVLLRPDKGEWVVTLLATKNDGSNGIISAKILSKDGAILQQDYTSNPFGEVFVSVTID